MSKENSRDCEVYLGVVNLVLKNYANFENDSVHKAFPRKTHKSMFDAILDVMGRSDSRSAISRFHYPRVILIISFQYERLGYHSRFLEEPPTVLNALP